MPEDQVRFDGDVGRGTLFRVWLLPLLALLALSLNARADLVADYRFDGNRDSDVAGAPALTFLGEGQKFVTATIGAQVETVLDFPRGNGVELRSTDAVISRNQYTISLLFEFDSLTDWTKLIDFGGGVSDPGLYIDPGHLLRFYGAALNDDDHPVASRTWVEVSIARNAATREVSIWLNGTEVNDFVDDAGVAVIGSSQNLRFVTDDSETGGGEAAPGKLARIRVWNEVIRPDIWTPVADQPVLTFTRLAGSDGGIDSIDAIAGEARFGLVSGLAVDGVGNVYAADPVNRVVRRITPNGVVSTLAGVTGAGGSSDGSTETARFQNPVALAIDANGNTYVADAGGQTIRRITREGMVTTFAGGAESPGSVDGIGTSARFRSPNGVALDGHGNLYVSDTGNRTIRRVSSGGVVTTIAGMAGASGSVDGVGNAARFTSPRGMAVDSAGNVYVADSGSHTIRKVKPDGQVSTLAGLAGTSGNEDGAGSAARFKSPTGVAIESDGNILVADSSNSLIRRVTPDGEVTTVAGRGGAGWFDGPTTLARFLFPSDVAVAPGGLIYVADRANSIVRRITPDGEVDTLAGRASQSGVTDGTGSEARFRVPLGITIDGVGNVYVADQAASTIRRISGDGVVTTFAGLAGQFGSGDGTGSAARFNEPSGVASDASGNVYVADTYNHTIRKVTPNGVVSTIAGLPGVTGSTDGTGSAARFNTPFGLTVGKDGNLYVADTLNRTIRRVTPAGVVTTIAGLAGQGGSDDGTGSAARFDSPFAIAAGPGGTLYVADYEKSTVRAVTPDGTVTTLAGSPGVYGTEDGVGAAARFFFPDGIAVDAEGDIYVAEQVGETIRRITPDGSVSTIAGRAQNPGNVEGAGGAARFDWPAGVAVDAEGNLYVTCVYGRNVFVGRATLPDSAMIDASRGTVGSTRVLGVEPRTADSWRWSIVRRPGGSAATFSSETVESPTFRPDKAGLYIFRLVARGAEGSSVTTIQLDASAPRRRPVRLP